MIAPQLSPRERDVLTLLIRGKAIAHIARDLQLTESTAKTHVANLYEKFGTGNRAQTVMAARRLGFTEGDDGGALLPARPKPPMLPPAAVALEPPCQPRADRRSDPRTAAIGDSLGGDTSWPQP